MPERERRVGRVDYSEGAQLRAHIDREVMGKLKQSALSALLKELTNPGGSRKWEDEDCPGDPDRSPHRSTAAPATPQHALPTKRVQTCRHMHGNLRDDHRGIQK